MLSWQLSYPRMTCITLAKVIFVKEHKREKGVLPHVDS